MNSGFFQKNVPAFVCKGNKDFSKWVFLIGFILAYLPLNLLNVKNKGVKSVILDEKWGKTFVI